MAKKLKTVIITAALLVSLTVIADINDDIQRKQAEERRELALEKALKEQFMLKRKQQTIIANTHKNTIAESGKCIYIKQINTTKQSLIDEFVIDNLKAKYEDRCLSIKQINEFVIALQEIYQHRGFVTTKTGPSVPQTRLKQGVLDVSIRVGFVDSINFNSDLDFSSLATWMLFDDLPNQALNSNGINKRIDSINRLNAHQANLNIKPSNKEYFSNIVIHDNTQDYQAFSMTLDNSGSESTGVDKLKLNADFDDFLIPLSKWSLTYSFPTEAQKDVKDSNAYILDMSFPFRDYLFNYNATKSDYDTNQVLTTGDIFYSFGETKTQNFYLIKHLNKTNTQDNKIKLGLSLSDEKSYSKLRETLTKNEVASRKLSILSLAYEYLFQFSDQSALYLNPSINKGINEFDALNDSTSGLDAKAQFSLVKFYGYYLKPLILKEKQFSLMSTLNMQISEDQLFSAQSFSIGGENSVRGFKDESISAKSGFYSQNNLSTNLNQWLAPQQKDSKLIGSVFFDYGRIYPNTSDHEALSGTGVSLNYQHKNLDIKLTATKNLEKPDSINEDSARYFEVSYKF